MNKAEFAVCRIKEKLPGNQGFATKGSGCVVHCERLSSSWGWKCHFFIVTPSVVLCQEDLASDKIFVAEFLSKDKRGLETFEIKQMAEVCKDVVGRRLDNLDRDLYLTFVSVEPLDKRGFLKKMVKKGSLQTFRPLESFKSENKSTEELTEGLFCHVIVDLFHDREPTNSAFSTQTYKLVYELETCEFNLQDFGGTVKTFNQEFPPIGAVIFTKKGEFAGLLRNFSDNCVTAIFLPESSKADNSKGEDTIVTSTGDETCVASNGDQTKPQINSAQESQPGSGSTTGDKTTDDTNQTKAVSENVTSRGNNNTLISSEHVPENSEFTDVEASGAVIVEKENGDVSRKGGGEESDNGDATQDGRNVKKQFQECPEHLIPNDRTEKVETEKLLTSVNSATDESDFKEFEEKGGEICFDKTEKSSDAVEESLDKAGSFDEVEESLDRAGKHSDEAEAHEVEVVLCKSDKVSDKVEDPGELDKGIDEVAVGLCLKGESLGKVEEETCVVGEGPYSTEEGLDAVKESPGELKEGFAETQVDPCLEGGSLGKVVEGTDVVGGSPCSAEEGLDAVKESPGELEEGFAETQVDSCLERGSLGKVEEGTAVIGEGPCSAEEGRDALKESPGELEEESHKMENVADSETTVSADSVMGTSCCITEAADDATFRPTITTCDSSLTTVIQVCETSQQTENTENRELEDNNDSALNSSGNLSPESHSMMTVEQSDIAKEQSFACLPDKEDREMMELSIDNSVVNQENVISDSTDASGCTNSESTELVSMKPKDANQTDSIKTPDTDVAKELSQDDELTLVTQDNQELSSISERTVNTIYDSCDISVCITPPIEDVIETGIKDDGCLKEYKHSHDNVSENLCETDPSVDILTLSANDSEESRDLHVEPNVNAENEVTGSKDSVDPSDLRVIETEDDMDVLYNEVKSFDDHSEQYSPKLDSIQTGEDDEAVVTQKKIEEISVENGSVVAETSENSVDKRSVSFEEKTAESCEDSVSKEMPIGGTSFGGAVVLQRVDADALLTETVTNNPHILGDLGSCLDTEYQYGRVPCWRDLAELLAIAPEAYEHCGTFSATSPTEDLFVFLSATKPHLTIQDIKEALKEIDRLDVAHLLDRKIAGGVISEESVVGSLVERDDTDILGRMALKLDRKKTNNWKHLALQLSVPHRVLRNFGSHQQHNSTLMLLKYIPIYDPELTLDHLKGCLVSIGRQDAVAVLDKAGIPGDEPVKDILDDSDLLDQITDLLNDDPPNPHWRHLAKELKIPQEKCKIFEPAEDNNSPTKLLFRSIENCEPDLTFEELVLALVAMKRQDVLDILQKYFSSDDIDQILEENNLLAPAKDASIEQKES